MCRMSITRVQLFSVPVADQQRAKAFYVDVLGLELVRENPMGPDQLWVEVAPVGARTSITLVTWFPSMPPGSVKGIVLQADDVDAEYARLAAAGVAVTTPPANAPWGRFATFEDPDGNGLVLTGAPPAGA
jgi:predicted enzyme related to lactoylglutathione lyase